MPNPPRANEPGWQAWAEEQTVRILRAYLAKKLAASPPRTTFQIPDEPRRIDLDDRVIMLPRRAPQASTG